VRLRHFLTGVEGHRRWRAWTLVALAYAAATIILAGPFINFAHLDSAIYVGDSRLILWTLAWDSHAILNGLPLFHANIFYPAPDALAYNEHLIGLAAFFLPIYAATQKPVLAYNLLWLASWLLNALAGHALARRYVRDELAAAVGGLIFAFSFFRMLHGHGHLSLAWTFWIPLSLLALEQWYRRPGWLRAAWLTFTLVMQVLANWYLGVLVLLANGVFLACLVAFERGSAQQADATAGRRLAAARLIQGSVSAGALLAMIWPFARHYRGIEAGTVEASRFSADAAAYLMPPQNTWIGRALSGAGVAGPRWIWGEGTMYLGAVALAFAAIGLAAAWGSRRRESLPAFPRYAAVFFPLIGLLALVLSFGPVGAHVPTSWMPFTWLRWLPGLGGLRSAARFGLLVVLAVSVLGAAGAAWLHRRSPVHGRLATLLLAPLMLSEWYVVGFPAGKPQPAPIPAVYRYVAGLPARAIVSLPLGNAADWTREADYLYYSTAHWHPIVNGFGRSMPPDHHWIAGHMAAFAGPNSARTMRRLGIDYVVLHADRLPEGPGMLHEALQNTADFVPVMRDGQTYLFKVTSADRNGASKP
jgi:hypothetical protein